MKVALYARVSRDDLHCENQNRILRDWAVKNGCPDAVLLNETESTRKTRPVKEQMMLDVRAGKFDTIVITRIDRFARSLSELIMAVNEVINRGGRFVSVMNGFDFNKSGYNASDALMLHIFGAFAEFERELIRERTLEGLARARAQGKVLGRPRKKPPLESLPVATSVEVKIE